MTKISPEAFAVLKALNELQHAGFIQGGVGTAVLTDEGFDKGSLETYAEPVITREGQIYLLHRAE